MNEYLQCTEYFDFEHPLVQNMVDGVCPEVENPVDIACRLYNAVRDNYRYDPYSFSSKARNFSASFVIEQGRSYCIPKAVLLGAAARAKGIPSRLCLADVVNHLADVTFVQKLKSRVFAMHGCIELHIEGRWVKATPAFNRSLCEHFGVEPLEFDGYHDSIFQKFNGAERYMEYVADYGHFSDVPRDFIVERLVGAYPHLEPEIMQGGWLTKG
ncbi:MAG: transglutaminase family protein [Pseudobdellovibrionaceae bacterium]|nr:transglutaminase family protein [Pseudobdellovibrionaceae bacterium]